MKDKIETKKVSKCSTCHWWKNKQMFLNYRDETGFCINPKFLFNSTDGRLIGVVDTQNLRDRTKITGNPSNDFEVIDNSYALASIKPSRYLLQTEEEFGCIFHTPNK